MAKWQRGDLIFFDETASWYRITMQNPISECLRQSESK